MSRDSVEAGGDTCTQLIEAPPPCHRGPASACVAAGCRGRGNACAGLPAGGGTVRGGALGAEGACPPGGTAVAAGRKVSCTPAREVNGNNISK